MSRQHDQARKARARAVTNGARAHDLSTAGMSDAQAWRAQAEFELALGMRCHGCGRRISFGLRFVSIDVRDAKAPAVYRVACNRMDCDFAEQCREGADAMEMVEFAWCDELGVDGPSFGLGMKPAADPEPTEDGRPPDAQ